MHFLRHSDNLAGSVTLSKGFFFLVVSSVLWVVVVEEVLSVVVVLLEVVSLIPRLQRSHTGQNFAKLENLVLFFFKLCHLPYSNL